MKPVYAALVVVVVLALATSWLMRWHVVAVATNNLPVAYELDRWTGDVYLVGGGRGFSPAKDQTRGMDTGPRC